MNIRRGLFRVWLVLSLFWVAVVGWVGMDTITSDRWLKGPEPWEKEDVMFLPVRCENARGTPPGDYEKLEAFEPWNRYRGAVEACYYTEEKFRANFPEYADLSRKDVSTRLYKQIGWEPVYDGDKFAKTKHVASIALLPPLALLIIGSMIAWAVSGFRRAS